MTLEEYLSIAVAGSIELVLDEGTSRPMDGAVLVAAKFLPITGDVALLFDCRQAMIEGATVAVVVAEAVLRLEWDGVASAAPHTHPVAAVSSSVRGGAQHLDIASYDGARLSISATTLRLHLGSMPALSDTPPDLTDQAALASFDDMPSWTHHFVPLV